MSEVLCVIPSRERAEQSPGHILQRTTWAPRLSSRLCACRGILYYPRNKLRRAFFHAVLQKAVARRVDRVPPGRRTVPPAAAAGEERGGSRLAQGNYFGGRIAEATPASHLTQGCSNEDVPVKQCGCFNKAACSSHINWTCPRPLVANVKHKEFEHTQQNQNFSGTPARARHLWRVNGGT